MAGQFLSSEGDLEQMFVTDYALIDQYAMTGTLWTWGRNTFGGLGDNSITHRSSPVQTVAGGTNWKLVAGGLYHTAAIKTDGTLWTWGRNAHGGLGDNTIVHRSSPVQTVAGGTNWKSVGCGGYHAAAIKTDGTLWTWGYNTYGQLGDNTQVHRSSPVQTIAGGTNWKSVSGGFYHTAAIKTDGTLWTWGHNGDGRLGDNTSAFKFSPVQTIAAGTNWKLVAAGYDRTAAIKTDGTLWLWGRNLYGGLGDNSITHRSSPVQTVAGGTNWKLVAGGQFHTAAIKTDGTLWLWGANNYGQLGDNSTTHRSSPVQTVSGGTNWKSVSAGGANHTAAIKTDGTLWLWGRNSYGGLGDNSITHRSSPVQTIAAGTNWKLVACGLYHTTAVFFYTADKIYPPS
jgi:alpha-tubulin suppressor-like RCC1 family protein